MPEASRLDESHPFLCHSAQPDCGAAQFLDMKRHILLPLTLALVLGAHSAQAEPVSSAAGEMRFALRSDDFIAGYLAWRPAIGTALGLHEYDGKVTDFSRDSIWGE